MLFPLMGRDYQATVLSAGFGGFALGATPTTIAKLTAVTKTQGLAPTAFIILPLVSAFFWISPMLWLFRPCSHGNPGRSLETLRRLMVTVGEI